MGLATGNVLDRYVIESLLGSGAMGRVYRATDTRLRRAVALKVLDVATTGAETALALREARAAAAIVHPNVTAIFDADHSGGTSFIVMELVPGTPLRQLIGDQTVPFATRVRWLIEIAAALSAAHVAGIVHRDVKPENVIVREDGMIKVLDFGVARLAQSSTPALGIHGIAAASGPATGLAGTPAYMAPEQINGSAVDGRADQFAWGVLAYELLSGRLPWKAMNGPFGVLSAILQEVPDPLPPEVPAEVAAVVMRALSKQRAARFLSMVEVATALAPFSSGPLPILGPAPDSATRARAPAPEPKKHAAPSEPPASQPRTAALAYSVEPPPPEVADPRDTTPPPSLRSLAARVTTSLHATTPDAAHATRPLEGTAVTLGATRPTIRERRPPLLRAPDFTAPIDVAGHLALLPSDAACKGMFFIDLVRAGTKGRSAVELHQLAGILDRRYIPFRDYPMEDLVRLMTATARCAYPGLPAGQALRRLGQSAFEAVLATHIGRTMLGVLGRDAERMLLNAPRVFQILLNFGEITVEKRDIGVFVMRAERFPAFLETYQVGLLEGLLAHCRAHGRIRIALLSLADATFEIDLD
jgi:serine/threonine-protein kinase